MWQSAPNSGMELRTPNPSTWHSDPAEREPALSLGTAHRCYGDRGRPWPLVCGSLHLAVLHSTRTLLCAPLPSHSWKLRVHSEKPVAGAHPVHLVRVLLGWLWTGSSAVKFSSALEIRLCHYQLLREGRWPLGWGNSSRDGTRKDQRPWWSWGRLS